MNIFFLVWSYLKSRPLNTAINITLLAMGIAVITILLLFNNQLRKQLYENSRGIDLVIGAKGSPLQLILCNIFHIDFPTGNISVREADKIARNRLIRTAIPLALGDSYQSFRIVGTTHAYAALYEAKIGNGRWWQKSLEVAIGTNVSRRTGLKLNDTFASAHGLTESGHAHDEHRYVVKGIMHPTNSILDDLILTSVESIWEMHQMASAENHVSTDSSEARFTLVPSVAMSDSSKEITSVLVKYRSPLAAIQMPRLVNSQTSLQAASPAFETARLFSILGIGIDIIRAFADVLIAISALSIFIALYNSLKERRYDMAVMRSMGASRTKLLISILLEGGVLTLVGCCIGMGLGHAAVALLPTLLTQTSNMGMNAFIFYQEEWIILAGSLLLGLACALIPAVQAYRSDISKVLSGN